MVFVQYFSVSPSIILVFISSLFFSSAYAAYSPSITRHPDGRLEVQIQSCLVFQSVVKELIERCPVSDCVVVGVGRSPTPILAYLKALIELGEVPESYVKALPLTRFRYGVLSPDLNAENQAKLFQHFERYLGEIKTKKVFIVDWGGIGASLIAAHRYISLYLKQHSHDTEVTSFLIGDFNEVNQRLHPCLDIVVGLPFQIESEMNEQKFDEYSWFGTFFILSSDLESSDTQLVPKQAFVQLVQAMKFAMKKIQAEQIHSSRLSVHVRKIKNEIDLDRKIQNWIDVISTENEY